MTRQHIAPQSLASELDSFSREHEGWLVSLETRSGDGKIAVQARDLPLQGVTQAAHDRNDISVSVGDATRHLTHNIHGVTSVHFELAPDQAERALVIDAKDGSTTIIEFRSPRHAEDVGSLPV